jgi:hypothetical protein
MEQSSLEVFIAASVFIAVSTVSVAAASRRLEQHDVARLHRQLLVVVDRLAIDVTPRMCPDTTETAPNSPMARALHKSTP